MDVTTGPGSTVAVHDLGGAGEPLLICHATGFCGRAYQPLADLLGRSHRVWAVDLRGHGDSPAPEDLDFAWERVVHDVLAAAAAISAERLHVFGHSMGGAVALLTEAQHPGTFAGAYVYEPVVMGPGSRPAPNQNPLAGGARNRNEGFASREAAMWRYASRPPLSELGAASLAAYVTHGFEDLPDGTVRLKCRAEWEARTFESAGAVTTETVAPAAVPIVVATGAEDLSMLAALGPPLVAAVPDGRLVVYEHLGHFGPFQDLHRIAADVVAHCTPII
jgi:pimeloyl-ACP methyl ester carboxylesterase